MPFFNQHLEFKADFDTNFNIWLSNLRPVLNDLFQKFYTLYYSSNVVHFLNIDDEILKFLDINFSTLSKFVKQIKPIKYEALTIELSSDGQMIVSSSNIIFQNKNNKFIFVKENKPVLKICIKDRYAVFIASMYKNKFRFFEATLSSISKICENSIMMREFFYIYFAFLSKLRKPLKDIELDFIKSPIAIKSAFKFSSLENFVNKKDFFVKRYPKDKFMNSTNKNTLFASYLMLKVKKHIPQSYYKEIENFISQTNLKISTNHKSEVLATEIMIKYLELKFKANTISDKWIVRDYCNMATMQGECINLKIKSFKRLKAKHDRLMLNVRVEKAPEVEINSENPFLKLKLPDDIKMLTTKKEIVQESMINHNCVVSYIQKINTKKSFICSLRRDNERYTIEIKKRGSKFYLEQIKGFANSQPP